jgi:hypothetical protein
VSQHDDDEDEDRRAILGRKAMFIASAMSGMALMDGCSRPPPQPCLSVAPYVPADAAAAPDATAVMTPEAGLPEPMPCLSDSMEPPRRRSRPRFEAEPAPCLDVIPPGERYKAGDDDPSSEGQG